MSNRRDLSKMKYRELQDMYKDLARRANHRIEQVGNRRKYAPAYLRKYDPILFGNTIANIGTKKGMFALKKAGTKDNLITRILTVEGFLNNPFTEVSKVNKYVDELMKRTHINNADSLERLFDLYRQYGFDDYKDDSDTIIITMSEMFNNGFDPERLLKFLDGIDFETQEDHVTALTEAWDKISVRSSMFRDRTPEEIYNMSMRAMERRFERHE